MRPTTKAFDCVEMKLRAQDRIREATGGMDAEERAEWLKHRIEGSRFASFLTRPISKNYRPMSSGEDE